MENIIIKENKMGKTYHSQNNPLNISELLKNEYEDILNEIKKDNYQIRLSECDVFKELRYKNRVAGFVTYYIQDKCNYLLTNIYVTHGNRRQHLFSHELEYQYSNGQEISIYEPTRQIIEILIKLRYAKKITKTLVISPINFNINNTTALSTKTSFNKRNKLIKTNIYDLNICASLSVKIMNKDNYEIKYTPLTYDDNIHYKCDKIRDSLKKDYFDNIILTLINKDYEIERWLFLLQNKLPRKDIKTEEIIGTTTNLSPIFIENIKLGNITEKEAKLIQNQLFLELRTNQVVKEALRLRLDYLIYHSGQKIEKNNFSEENSCPYCNDNSNNLENYCLNCGYTLYDINKIDEYEFIYKESLNEKQSYKYSYFCVKEKKGIWDKVHRENFSIYLILSHINNGTFKRNLYDNISKENIIAISLPKELLLKKGYITFSMNENEWLIESQSLSKTELKQILKKHNCKVSGDKYQLIQRIKKEVPLKEIISSIPKITPKGLSFLKKHQYLQLYSDFLSDYVFREFEEYYKKKNKRSDDELMIDFLDEHIKIAYETRNQNQLINSLKLQSKFYLRCEYYLPALKNELTIFLIKLNMIFVDKEYYQYYQVFDEDTLEFFDNFNYNPTKEVFDKLYDEIIDSLKKYELNVSKNDSKYYLSILFEKRNVTYLNNKVKSRYYKTHKHKNIIKEKKNKIVSLDYYM